MGGEQLQTLISTARRVDVPATRVQSKSSAVRRRGVSFGGSGRKDSGGRRVVGI